MKCSAYQARRSAAGIFFGYQYSTKPGSDQLAVPTRICPVVIAEYCRPAQQSLNGFAFLRCARQHDLAYFRYDAGWSSLVARQAHNLKAAGSNPAPATNFPAVYRVYVLRNSRGQFYVGLTDNIPRRLDQHNQGISRWTRSKGPWELVWQSTDMELSAARKLENRLKRQGRGVGFYTITGLRRIGNS